MGVGLKMTKEQQKTFIDDCISSGKFVDYDGVTDFSIDTILEIEDILNRFNDKSARAKIRKILKKL